MPRLEIAVFCPSPLFHAQLEPLRALPSSDEHMTYLIHRNIYVSNYGGETQEAVWHLLSIHRELIAAVGAGVVANVVYGIIRDIFKKSRGSVIEIKNLTHIDVHTLNLLSAESLERFLRDEHTPPSME